MSGVGKQACPPLSHWPLSPPRPVNGIPGRGLSCRLSRGRWRGQAGAVCPVRCLPPAVDAPTSEGQLDTRGIVRVPGPSGRLWMLQAASTRSGVLQALF
ncbi:hypothetical protein ACOMHN_046118 [Nucella lapillus]